MGLNEVDATDSMEAGMMLPGTVKRQSGRGGTLGNVEILPYPPRAAIIAERLTLVAAVRGISSTNSTVLGTL